jgi:hypothetical protein
MMESLEKLTAKKAQLDKLRPFPPELIRNLDEWYRVELTYTSNAIEGNMLSRAETALVVEKAITVEGKSIREHLEAVNHAQAFEFIKTLARKNLYLEAVREAKGLPIQPAPERLLKIGEVARLAGEPVPTIRYWTQHGLLVVKDFSPGGYQLYEPAMVEPARQIRRWQNVERLTLAEIKAAINEKITSPQLFAKKQ